MSTRSPPFAPPNPVALWPPDRTVISRSCSRAKRTAVATSSVVDGRAITAGRRSWIPFHRRRPSSYPASPGVITSAHVRRSCSRWFGATWRRCPTIRDPLLAFLVARQRVPEAFSSVRAWSSRMVSRPSFSQSRHEPQNRKPRRGLEGHGGDPGLAARPLHSKYDALVEVVERHRPSACAVSTIPIACHPPSPSSPASRGSRVRV
jgi:hypothetical protein